jgi:hypothetical protein
MFNFPRVRHCIEIDLASMKKEEFGFGAQKTCMLTVEMLHLNEKIGQL